MIGERPLSVRGGSLSTLAEHEAARHHRCMTVLTSAPYLEAQARRQEMEQRLAGLERALAAPSAAPGWAATVRDSLLSLHQSLAHHVVAVEAPDGLLPQIIDAAPRLANAVKRLEADHRRLSEAISTLVEDTSEGEPDAVRELAVELLRDMALHRQRGSDLVYEAYSTDIGGYGS